MRYQKSLLTTALLTGLVTCMPVWACHVDESTIMRIPKGQERGVGYERKDLRIYVASVIDDRSKNIYFVKLDLKVARDGFEKKGVKVDFYGDPVEIIVCEQRVRISLLGQRSVQDWAVELSVTTH